MVEFRRSRAVARRVVARSTIARRLVTSRGWARIRGVFTGIRPGSLTDDDLARLLRRPDPIILEIGAHDGSTTNRFLRLFEKATVYAFEPDPRASEKYRANVTNPRASLFELAIADQDGTATFHMSGGRPAGWEGGDRGWDGSGSIHPPTGHLEVHPSISFDRQIEVSVKRLDSWAAEEGIGEVDFIWADVQGAERELIAGGLETLRRTRYFYTEYSNRELYEGQITLGGILSLLPDFQVVTRFIEDVLLRNTRFARVEEQQP